MISQCFGLFWIQHIYYNEHRAVLVSRALIGCRLLKWRVKCCGTRAAGGDVKRWRGWLHRPSSFPVDRMLPTWTSPPFSRKVGEYISRRQSASWELSLTEASHLPITSGRLQRMLRGSWAAFDILPTFWTLREWLCYSRHKSVPWWITPHSPGLPTPVILWPPWSGTSPPGGGFSKHDTASYLLTAPWPPPRGFKGPFSEHGSRHISTCHDAVR